jgi:nickel-dependent lactate racemase
MPILINRICETGGLSTGELQRLTSDFAGRVATGCRRVLLIPPDLTRRNSGAGVITAQLYRQLAEQAEVRIMPALGTHLPMTAGELAEMFGTDIPLEAFRVHDWRKHLMRSGEVAASFVRELSRNRLDSAIQIDVSRELFSGYDLIVSIGQVVPHEVAGMANYTKNLLVGTGGPDMINKSHFLGAICGMEQIMGRIDTPVRRLYNHAARAALSKLPITYILTVAAANEGAGPASVKGFFAGSGDELFRQAAELSQRVNITLLDQPLKKVIVYLEAAEFKSTWLGNKAIYRTRMALADRASLIILAPGLQMFGEDAVVDKLIRRHGYRGTPAVLAAVAEDRELRDNLSAAAHLIHGSSESRFDIIYCPGPGLNKNDIERVGYRTANLDTMLRRYDPARLAPGFNVLANGEALFFVRNPALGLWSTRALFQGRAAAADGQDDDGG